MAEVVIRDLAEVDDLRSALELFERIWGAEDRMFAVEVLRAVATHGGAILGAFLDGRMVGAQVAFLGRDDGELLLHSHVTGVEPTLQHEGIGTALKWAQRDWALERGIELITWTFDPMISRNAYLNLRKLGASARRFLRDFYGRMDDDINVGERSDRLEITWRLRDPRVEGAAAGGPVARDAEGAAVLLDAPEGRPRPHPEALGAPLLLARIPTDYLDLRAQDPELARAWRDATADVLEGALSGGYVAVDFLREGAYVLERS